jgi:hypothetical protein
MGGAGWIAEGAEVCARAMAGDDRSAHASAGARA